MATTATTNSISVFALLDALRRRKLFVIVPTLLLAAGFALYAYTQPTRYRATASLAVEQSAPPEYLKHVASAPLKEAVWPSTGCHRTPDQNRPTRLDSLSPSGRDWPPDGCEGAEAASDSLHGDADCPAQPDRPAGRRC